MIAGRAGHALAKPNTAGAARDRAMLLERAPCRIACWHATLRGVARKAGAAHACGAAGAQMRLGHDLFGLRRAGPRKVDLRTAAVLVVLEHQRMPARSERERTRVESGPVIVEVVNHDRSVERQPHAVV